MNRPLGCLSRSGIVAAVLTVLVLAGVMLLWGGRPFSPGALNAHAGQAALGGVRSHAETGGHCSACHATPWSKDTMSDRCLACHTPIASQLEDPSTLHGVLKTQEENFRCRGCHVDHLGPDAPLTTLDPKRFPHEAVGYSLQGHGKTAQGAAFTCQDCHGQGLSHFDVATCETCHRQLDAAFVQAHEQAYGLACLACHDGVDTYGPKFDHAKQPFPLQGKHAGLPCGDCHTGARSPADLKATPQACYACHQKDDPHQGQFGQDCGGCHTPEDWEKATFDHSKAAFPLTGAHQQVECAKCHVNNVFKGTPQDCYSCHQKDDPHQGQFGHDCAACHTPDGWKQVTFDHSKAAFPLTGAHLQLECAKCHVNNIFKGTPQDCYSCHQKDDPHQGQFGHDCAACHTPDGWKQVTFDHSKTAFPLTGAHLQVECAKCHVNNVFKGTPHECSACHAEPDLHKGLLGTDCAACHTTDAWSPAKLDRPHPFPFGHGASGPSPCRTCHPDSMKVYTCYGCHEHTPAEIAAKHREEGITDFQDCVKCHPTGRTGD